MTVGVGSVVEGPFLPDGLVSDWSFSFTAHADGEVVPRLVTATGSSIPAHLVQRANAEDAAATGGIVRIDPPLAAGSGELWISYLPSMAQGVVFEDQARFSPAAMNGALDLAAARDQYLDARLDRAQKVRLGELGPGIPPRAVRAGRFRAWTDAGLDERTDISVASWFSTVSQLAMLQDDVRTLQAQVATLFGMFTRGGEGSGGGVGLDLARYLDPADAITDVQLAAYVDSGTAGWPNVADKLRQAFADAGAVGVPVDATRVRGMFFVDPGPTGPDDIPWPILIRNGSGFIGPETAKCQMGYLVDGAGTVRYQLNNPGLTFIVDTHSARKDTPWFARQGGTVIRGLQIAGVGLLNDVQSIDVAAYPTISGCPTDHAPVLVTDHRHDPLGQLLDLGDSAKAGLTVCQAHIIGVMQAAYHGDPLPQEEPWAYLQDADGNVVYRTVDGESRPVGITASGQQTGLSFTEELTLTATPMKRVLGVARSTAGGFRCRIQAIPPYGTFMSQANSAGRDPEPENRYRLLKWFQRNGTVLERWHRMVGFDISVEARGFRYGEFVKAGYAPEGPPPFYQDTGKVNAGVIRFGCERVVTAVHVDPDAYLHRYTAVLNGHYMDEYNLKGETGPLIEILTDGAKAGAIDKAVYDAAKTGVEYGIDDKVGYAPAPFAAGKTYDPGDQIFDGQAQVWTCTVGGAAHTAPSLSAPTVDNVAQPKIFSDPQGPVRWAFEGAPHSVFSCTTAGTCTLAPRPAGPNYNAASGLFTDPDAHGAVWIFRNGGFKPVGDPPFAITAFSGTVQETAGPVFLNTVADGHKFHDLSGLNFSNWQQAKANHGRGAIVSAGANTLIKHHNAMVSASGNAKRVYETDDLSTLWIGNNGYFGYALNADGSDPPEIMGNLPQGSTYFADRGCEAFNFGAATGDDPDPDDDGGAD